MSERPSHRPDHENLIDRLAKDLERRRPLPAPWRRCLAWTALVACVAAILASQADLHALRLRMAVPDLTFAAVGSGLTALAAAFAAFQSSVPGRDARWAWLTLPPAALWVGASGLGCLRDVVVPDTEPTTLKAVGGCFWFILSISLPLGAVLILMLRRAYPLNPHRTAALSGLAAAAAAATLLVFFHPHDATAEDLAVHAIVVALVIGANSALGGRLLGRA